MAQATSSGTNELRSGSARGIYCQEPIIRGASHQPVSSGISLKAQKDSESSSDDIIHSSKVSKEDNLRNEILELQRSFPHFKNTLYIFRIRKIMKFTYSTMYRG